MAAPVKLVFIHHSTGEAWLADAHGGLGMALRDNDYCVSDTNYGWGPEAIGDRTDIGHWWSWFRSPQAPTYLSALYAESGRHCSYSRLATDPGGANQIVLFKSCFPNSDLRGSAAAAPPAIGANPLKGQGAGGADFTVANAKGICADLLPYCAAHQEKLFVCLVAPPIQSPGIRGASPTGRPFRVRRQTRTRGAGRGLGERMPPAQPGEAGEVAVVVTSTASSSMTTAARNASKTRFPLALTSTHRRRTCPRVTHRGEA